MEKWVDIKGFNGKYQVSDTGKVRSLCYKKPRILSTSNTGKYRNYLAVKLYKGGRGTGKDYKVHRLVAEAFLPNPDNKPQVNHIDGNTFNNDVSNLEWVTNQENQKHAWNNGLHKTTKAQQDSCREASKIWIKKHPNGNNCSLTLEEVAEIKMMLADGKLKMTVIADLYNVSYKVVQNIKNGKTYKNVNIKEWI